MVIIMILSIILNGIFILFATYSVIGKNYSDTKLFVLLNIVCVLVTMASAHNIK